MFIPPHGLSNITRQHITQVHLGRCRLCGVNIGDTLFKSQRNNEKGYRFDDKNVRHVEKLRARHEEECPCRSQKHPASAPSLSSAATNGSRNGKNMSIIVFNEKQAQSWCDAMEQWSARRKEKGKQFPNRPWSDLTYELIKEACLSQGSSQNTTKSTTAITLSEGFQNPYNLEGNSGSHLTPQERQDTLPKHFDTGKPHEASDSGYGSLKKLQLKYHQSINISHSSISLEQNKLLQYQGLSSEGYFDQFMHQSDFLPAQNTIPGYLEKNLTYYPPEVELDTRFITGNTIETDLSNNGLTTAEKTPSFLYNENELILPPGSFFN